MSPPWDDVIQLELLDRKSEAFLNQARYVPGHAGTLNTHLRLFLLLGTWPWFIFGI